MRARYGQLLDVRATTDRLDQRDSHNRVIFGDDPCPSRFGKGAQLAGRKRRVIRATRDSRVRKQPEPLTGIEFDLLHASDVVGLHRPNYHETCTIATGSGTRSKQPGARSDRAALTCCVDTRRGAPRSVCSMVAPIRGRLLEASNAPTRGERVEQLLQVGGTVIEQILSSEVGDAIDYDQDHDEWVVLLAGKANLEIDGDRLALEAGDWLFLPRGTPHRLVRTTQGANWLAVRVSNR